MNAPVKGVPLQNLHIYPLRKKRGVSDYYMTSFYSVKKHYVQSLNIY